MNIPIPDVAELTSALGGEVTSLQFVTRGGFKAVFKGFIHENMSEAVKAIYIPNIEDGISEELRNELIARAKREIELLGSCTSPSIVKLGNLTNRVVNVTAGTYIVYSEEFLPGSELTASISKENKPNPQRLLAVFRFLIEVIDEMIRIGYVHRDIKPSNIFETGLSDRPFVILDMGIAYKMRGTNFTQGPLPPGTLVYMAPELLQPDYKDIMDFRCDLYSAALSVYELATGIQPFASQPGNEYATMYRILHDHPRRLKELRNDLPENFCRIIDRCIRKKPPLRYATLKLLNDDLREVKS